MGNPAVPATAEARLAFDRRQWSAAYDALAVADTSGSAPLAAGDLDLLMAAAYLTGREEVGDEVAARAHRAHLDTGDRPAAARSAFWLSVQLLLRGAELPSAGWLERARACLDEDGRECVERGYLLILEVLARLRAGENEAALTAALGAVRWGERFSDADLLALGRLARGQALVALGSAADGLESLDQAMAASTAGDLSAMVAGIVYCAVIEECHRVLDLRRAQQWTAALSHWCDAQPDLAPYRGQCLVHRSEIMLLHGSWSDALDEADRACERLVDTAAAGEAYYQLAEVHRVRGETGPAQEAYRRASRWLPSGQPGTALLWLADGRADAAAVAIRRALAEPAGHVARPRLLAAAVEILAAADDPAGARAAADELRVWADRLDTPWARALASHADGAARLAEGDAEAALRLLRGAWTAWRSIDAPYEAARVRLLIGLALRALGDPDSAEMELDAARWVFEQLGAGPDAARARGLARSARPGGVLSAREAEVLRLVATGRTNRAIAAELFLSEKTVARHLSNIFRKLDVSSRAAATAYAFRHDLA